MTTVKQKRWAWKLPRAKTPMVHRLYYTKGDCIRGNPGDVGHPVKVFVCEIPSSRN